MGETTDTEDSGVFASGARVLKTLCELAENRIELFLVELQEERARSFDALLLAVAGGVCALMAMVLVTLTVVVIFWETHRVLVLTGFSIFYAGAAAAAFWAFRSRVHRGAAFSETLEQIKKDRACFDEPS